MGKCKKKEQESEGVWREEGKGEKREDEEEARKSRKEEETEIL